MQLDSEWPRKKLGELARYVNGAAFKPTDWGDAGTPIIRIQNLTERSRPFNRTKREVKSELLVENGDLLFSWSATIDAFIWSGERAWLNQHIFRVFPNYELVTKEFLYSVLRAVADEIIRSEHLHGTTMGHVNRKPLLSYEVAVPPLDEQVAIVRWIEEHHSRYSAIREDLASVLKLNSAYLRQLTSRSFAQRQDDDDESSDAAAGLELEGLPTLQDGWTWGTIEDLAVVTGGITKNAARSENPIELPYLRVANVYDDRLFLDEVKKIRVTPGERDRALLQKGDLLVVEGNGSVGQIGRVAEWDGSIAPCLHQNHLIKIRTRDRIPSRYLLHWLKSPFGRRILELMASSSSGLHTLSISKIKRTPIPLTEPKRMGEIVDRLDLARDSMEAVTRDVDRGLALLDRAERRLVLRVLDETGIAAP